MQHPVHYNANESRRRSALLARGAFAVTRGKSTARIDAELEALAEEACRRERAEREVAAKERTAAQERARAAKAARRAESRWW